MAIKIIQTADGSTSFYHEELNETYHSKHGAIQESMHVFIAAGLLPLFKDKKEIHILEMGFGTGLNAWLSAIKSEEHQIKIIYTGIEAFPVKAEQVEELNYPNWGKNEFEKQLFFTIQDAPWETLIHISQQFRLKKVKSMFEGYQPDEEFDLIYFDAFGPATQPELWSDEIFGKMYGALKTGGTLVTYSVKGSVRRAMKTAGFKVEKIPGPPGKREMCRALKVESE